MAIADLLIINLLSYFRRGQY